MKKSHSINAPWISVDRSVNHPREERLESGVTVKFVLTPDNVPTAMRIFMDAEEACFVLEFRYFGDEATEKHTVEHGIVVRIGKYTGRLFQIRVPRRLVDETVREHVELDLSSALRQFITNAMADMRERPDFTSKGVRKSYYAVTSDVVMQNDASLFTNIH